MNTGSIRYSFLRSFVPVFAGVVTPSELVSSFLLRHEHTNSLNRFKNLLEIEQI